MMFVFLAYLTGYFLQTFPVGCLFLSAFPDEKLCMERRRAVSIYAALTAGLSLLLSGISVWILLNGRMVNAGLGSLLLNLGIVLIVICLWQMLQRGTKDRAAALLFAVHYEAVIVAVNTVLMELPFVPDWSASYGFTETLAYTPAAPFGLFLLTAVSWVPARLFFGATWGNSSEPCRKQTSAGRRSALRRRSERQCSGRVSSCFLRPATRFYF